jgi:hypothetical protein
MMMTKKQQQREERLVRRAAAALVALAEFRERHDIEVTCEINGWSRPASRRIARCMLAAGVSAQAARVLFAESTRVRQ